MSVALQWVVIGVLAAIALLYAVWRIGTPRLRLRILDWLLAALPGRVDRPGPVRAGLLRRRAALTAKGGCEACSR